MKIKLIFVITAIVLTALSIKLTHKVNANAEYERELIESPK